MTAAPRVVELGAPELRRGFGAFPSGVTAVAGLVDGIPEGLTASSFTSVSLEPPIVSVCIATGSRTWSRLRAQPRIGVSILGAHQEAAARRLATRGDDRFRALSWQTTDDGALFLDTATAWLDCSVAREVEAGDHDLILLRVHSLRANPHIAPLVFHNSRFRRLEPEP